MGDFILKGKYFPIIEPNTESSTKLGLMTSNVNKIYKCLILALISQGIFPVSSGNANTDHLYDYFE